MSKLSHIFISSPGCPEVSINSSSDVFGTAILFKVLYCKMKNVLFSVFFCFLCIICVESIIILLPYCIPNCVSWAPRLTWLDLCTCSRSYVWMWGAQCKVLVIDSLCREHVGLATIRRSSDCREVMLGNVIEDPWAKCITFPLLSLRGPSGILQIDHTESSSS